MNIREIFAQNLRAIRKARDLSQEELALRADVHRTYISSLERCVYSPTIDMVDSLAKILGVDASELLAKTAQSGKQAKSRLKKSPDPDPPQ